MFKKIKNTLSAFEGTIVSLIRILRNPETLKQNELPKIKHKTIRILGNGPSLNDVLESIVEEKTRDYDLIAVNKFCLSTEYEKVKPTHYIVVDPDFFSKHEEESLRQMQQNVQRVFEQETTWRMNLFVPRNEASLTYAEYLRKTNPHIQIYFFNTLTIEGPELLAHKLYSSGVGMPFVGNVLVAANILAINMGYKKIELYGAEQSIHIQAYVNAQNQVCVEYDYFDGSKIEAVFWDDLDPTKPQKYHQFLTHWTDTFKSYHLINAYAESKECRVINMTENSYIDAFERNSNG